MFWMWCPTFVGDDVGLRELARRAELAGQLVEELHVDVGGLVGGAVEGPRARTWHAATGVTAPVNSTSVVGRNSPSMSWVGQKSSCRLFITARMKSSVLVVGLAAGAGLDVRVGLGRSGRRTELAEDVAGVEAAAAAASERHDDGDDDGDDAAAPGDGGTAAHPWPRWSET